MSAKSNQMRIKEHARTLLLGLVIVGLAGCGRGTRDLEEQIAEIKKKPGAPIEPLPTEKPFETFEYTAQNLRDPFSLIVEKDAGNEGPRPDMNRPKEALEEFQLDSLDMVGTIKSQESLIGLIKDPDGVIHQVRQGNYMGKNFGSITVILEDRIELVELTPDGGGGWKERPAKIALDDQ